MNVVRELQFSKPFISAIRIPILLNGRFKRSTIGIQALQCDVWRCKPTEPGRRTTTFQKHQYSVGFMKTTAEHCSRRTAFHVSNDVNAHSRHAGQDTASSL